MSDLEFFEEVLGKPRKSFSEKREVKQAIIKSILDSETLERTLAGIETADRRLVSYARDLRLLISHGIITVDQAILSFTRLRHEIGTGPSNPINGGQR